MDSWTVVPVIAQSFLQNLLVIITATQALCKCCPCTISFHLYHTPKRQVPLFSKFIDERENWDSQRLSNVPKFTQLVNSNFKIRTRISLTPKHMLLTITLEDTLTWTTLFCSQLLTGGFLGASSSGYRRSLDAGSKPPTSFLHTSVLPFACRPSLRPGLLWEEAAELNQTAQCFCDVEICQLKRGRNFSIWFPAKPIQGIHKI